MYSSSTIWTMFTVYTKWMTWSVSNAMSWLSMLLKKFLTASTILVKFILGKESTFMSGIRIYMCVCINKFLMKTYKMSQISWWKNWFLLYQDWWNSHLATWRTFNLFYWLNCLLFDPHLHFFSVIILVLEAEYY